MGYRGVKQGQDKVKLARYGTGIVRFRMKPHGQGRAKRSKGIDVLSSVMAKQGGDLFCKGRARQGKVKKSNGIAPFSMIPRRQSNPDLSNGRARRHGTGRR